MDQYLADLDTAIANLLDAFDAVEPLRILTKIKLHLCAHIPSDVPRFGPLIRSSTEIYKAYNGAPSRDISKKFVAMGRVKHLLSGGFWEESPGKWTQSGVAVQETLQTGAILQRHLGWVPQRKSKYGTIVPLSLKRKPPIKWKDSAAACHSNLAPKEKGWSVGRSLSTMDGDEVSVSSWVVAKHNGRTVFGRSYELLVGVQHFVTLEQFMVASELHPIFRFIPLQHDCCMGHCKPAVVEKQMQERQETTQDRSLIKHTDDDHFILNMGRAPSCARASRDKGRKKTAEKRRETAAARRRIAQTAADEAREQKSLRKRPKMHLVGGVPYIA
ncbi:hypothetical protein R3P38DRAFT_3336712 [Favolaschia claudopus]|uniref:Uncharacterized protein n=1 Tax=Favolaschia claudopus TaxID=2862362 RepID=A0AAV9Z546_9AGAR